MKRNLFCLIRVNVVNSFVPLSSYTLLFTPKVTKKEEREREKQKEDEEKMPQIDPLEVIRRANAAAQSLSLCHYLMRANAAAQSLSLGKGVVDRERASVRPILINPPDSDPSVVSVAAMGAPPPVCAKAIRDKHIVSRVVFRDRPIRVPEAELRLVALQYSALLVEDNDAEKEKEKETDKDSK
ncbi:hypothetical protein KIPB_011963, partial [Kipferlia bialata]|eukprot:g11963.t1